MPKHKDTPDLDWLHHLKNKILFGILAILTFSIVATMVFIAAMLRDSLIKDSMAETEELGDAIKLSLGSLMLSRNPGMMQSTMEAIGQHNHSLEKAFILDRNGKIAYSSDKSDVGRKMDRFVEPSCQGCHKKIDAAPSEHTMMMRSGSHTIMRNVKVIYNEEACFGCHSKNTRINGKLIIDRSLGDTYSLITKVELIIFGSGIVCIVFLIPFLSKVLSRGVNRYIDEIVRQNVELRLLYVMIERLSKTLDFEELKKIVIEILKESLSPDEVDMVFHKNYNEYRVTSWSRKTDTIERKKVGALEPLAEAIDRWLANRIKEAEVLSGNMLIYMPIKKSDLNLALIVLRRNTAPFDPVRLKLLDVMISHISVAFENAMLYHIAITDELTGLFTQRHFRTMMDRKLADFEKYGEKFSLLMIDADDFKLVNDTHGHPVGDDVLIELAKRILISIRDNDFAFRYGGEEFAVILTSTGTAGAEHVAERIRSDIAAFVFKEGALNIRLTVSIGAAICPENAISARDLLMSADRALYKAKRTGKNRVEVGDSA